LNWSPNRANRTFQIFNGELSCPTTRNIINDAVFADQPVPDLDDFEEINLTRGYRAVSYLMSSSWFAQGPAEQALARRGNGRQLPFNGRFYADTIEKTGAYLRVDRVARQPASKSLFADGTRYFSNTGLDFDAAANPSVWGSFTEQPPTKKQSTAWSDENTSGFVRRPDNERLSYRHNDGMNAAYMDGHVEFVDNDASRIPDQWHPSGAVVNVRQSRAQLHSVTSEHVNENSRDGEYIIP